MTIKEALNFGSYEVSSKTISEGKQYSWIVKDDGFGFWTYDEQITRVNVVDGDTINVSTEWESARNKRLKQDQPAPITTLKNEQISGFKIHSSIPGTKRTLQWFPSNKQ